MLATTNAAPMLFETTMSCNENGKVVKKKLTVIKGSRQYHIYIASVYANNKHSNVHLADFVREGAAMYFVKKLIEKYKNPT